MTFEAQGVTGPQKRNKNEFQAISEAQYSSKKTFLILKPLKKASTLYRLQNKKNLKIFFQTVKPQFTLKVG